MASPAASLKVTAFQPQRKEIALSELLTAASGDTIEIELDDLESATPISQEQIRLMPDSRYLIGRGEECDLRLSDERVSRVHLQLRATPAGLVVKDEWSTNGTKLNGVRLHAPCVLGEGDTLRVGNVEIQILELGGLRPREGHCVADSVTALAVEVGGLVRLRQVVRPNAVDDMLERWKRVVTQAMKDCEAELVLEVDDCLVCCWEQSFAGAAVICGQTMLQETKDLVTAGAWPYERDLPWQCSIAVCSNASSPASFESAGERSTLNKVLGLLSYAQERHGALIVSGDGFQPPQSWGVERMELGSEGGEQVYVFRV